MASSSLIHVLYSYIMPTTPLKGICPTDSKPGRMFAEDDLECPVVSLDHTIALWMVCSSIELVCIPNILQI